MERTVYHKVLRVSSVVLALVLVFDSGYLLPQTSFLSENTQHYLANTVSVGAGVQPNELNVITAELTQRSKELDEREAVLSSRELQIGLSSPQQIAATNNLSTYILSTILFILLVLIVLNYALDYVRSRARDERFEQTA